MRDCPCRYCEDKRTPTCHGTCEDYKKFDQKCKEIREKRYSEYQSSYYSKSKEKLVKKKERH